MNKRYKKGFTLSELLVVVAIIAVLVAIAIPVFTSQLEKARQTRDLANIRAAYAEVMVAAASGDTNVDTSISVLDDEFSPLKSNPNIWYHKAGDREHFTFVKLSSDPEKWNENKAYEPLMEIFDNVELGIDETSFQRKDGDIYAVVCTLPFLDKNEVYVGVVFGQTDAIDDYWG